MKLRMEPNSKANLNSLPYYLSTEVALHNNSDDCWVIINKAVYDLTELCKIRKRSKDIRPILGFAGKDISHWFDKETGDIKRCIDSFTGKLIPFLPYGLIPDIEEISPGDYFENTYPWWKNESYKIGCLSSNERSCKIINVLTGTQTCIKVWFEKKVCEEDTLERIQERYLKFNSHAASYTFKYQRRRLDLNKTLTENGILDERERYYYCDLPVSTYIPSLLCYYNDDLTES